MPETHLMEKPFKTMKSEDDWCILHPKNVQRMLFSYSNPIDPHSQSISRFLHFMKTVMLKIC